MGSHRVGHDWSDLAATAAHQRPHTHKQANTHTHAHIMRVSTALGVRVCVCVCVCVCTRARIKQDHPAWGTVVMHNNPPLVPTLALSISTWLKFSTFQKESTHIPIAVWLKSFLKILWRNSRRILCHRLHPHSSNLYLLAHFSPACGQWVSFSLPLKLSFLGVHSLCSTMFLQIPYLIPCFQLLPCQLPESPCPEISKSKLSAPERDSET